MEPQLGTLIQPVGIGGDHCPVPKRVSLRNVTLVGVTFDRDSDGPSQLVAIGPRIVAYWRPLATDRILMADCRFRRKADVARPVAGPTPVVTDAVDGAHSAASECHRVVA